MKANPQFYHPDDEKYIKLIKKYGLYDQYREKCSIICRRKPENIPITVFLRHSRENETGDYVIFLINEVFSCYVFIWWRDKEEIPIRISALVYQGDP